MLERWNDDRLDDLRADVKYIRESMDRFISSSRWTPATIAIVMGPVGAAIVAAIGLSIGHK